MNNGNEPGGEVTVSAPDIASRLVLRVRITRLREWSYRVRLAGLILQAAFWLTARITRITVRVEYDEADPGA